MYARACVCACAHMPIQAIKHSLVQSSQMPMKIDLCGEGRHLCIHLVDRKAASMDCCRVERKVTNPWRAVGCALNLLSNNSTSMEHCFSVVLVSVEGWLFRVQC